MKKLNLKKETVKKLSVKSAVKAGIDFSQNGCFTEKNTCHSRTISAIGC